MCFHRKWSTHSDSVLTTAISTKSLCTTPILFPVWMRASPCWKLQRFSRNWTQSAGTDKPVRPKKKDINPHLRQIMTHITSFSCHFGLERCKTPFCMQCEAWRHTSERNDSIWRFLVVVASHQIGIASSSPTPLISWVTSFALDMKRYHIIPLTQIANKSFNECYGTTNVLGLMCNVFGGSGPSLARFAAQPDNKLQGDHPIHFETPAKDKLLALRIL